MIPNIAKPTSEIETTATSKARLRKNESGIIGSAWRSSQITNATRQAAATARKPIVCTEIQLCEFVRISAQTSENRPTVISIVPTTSKPRALGSRDSDTAQSVATAASTPIGTLIQKTADQLTCSTRKPPSNGPTASPRPEMPAQMPIAVGT